MKDKMITIKVPESRLKWIKDEYKSIAKNFITFINFEKKGLKNVIFDKMTFFPKSLKNHSFGLKSSNFRIFS